jgi:serine/threonine protein kinase/tetratricopeptide (TPR) repeat protein
MTGHRGPNDDLDATMAVRLGVTVGQTFADRYDVEALLGRGGMGSVYRVRDRAVDEQVALKLLDAAVATPEAIERFRREVRLARRVTHRNAARTYDLGEWQGQRYLTMEYVDGQSLREFLPRGNAPQRLGHARIVDVATQIARGLAAAHQAGVVHRDLKPANVLIERGGRVVITDFGIARGTAADDATMHTGGLLGTPAYMAPEQLAGTTVDARADLYALGLIVFELLTGKLPFAGDTALSTALARLTQTPDLAAEPAIPARLVPLLERLLARELEQRLASADALIEQLIEIGREWTTEDPGTLGLSTTSGPASTTTTATSPATSPGITRSTATPTRRGRKLAVLPFRYRGPESERYVAETLSDELVDVLSTMKGLQVTGSGATARFADLGDRDPRTIGAELEVEAIVDGTVQLSGTRLRIAARLLDVATGFQLWSERYDGALADAFELQDKLGKRIAEALRLELEHIAHRDDASPEAIELYLRARSRAQNWEFLGDDGAVALYERCRELAPDFKPAMAGLAIACVRTWFNPGEDTRDWAKLSMDSVAVARVAASELAETQLAIAALAVQLGDYREAANALAQALRIAPTYAAAHDYLGRLQLEAGQPEQGIRHLDLAFELDPRLQWSRPDIARYHALRGDRDKFEAVFRQHVEAVGRDDELPVIALEIRVASWFHDFERVKSAYARLSPDALEARTLRPYVHLLVDDEVDGEEFARELTVTAAQIKNPRFRAMVLQVCAEALTHRGFEELALRCIGEAAESVLVDHDWLERCPLLAPLRTRPQYLAARELVMARARAIWGI